MTALLNMEFEDENGVTRKLHRKEVLHYTQVVAGAGNETTGRLIGWLAKLLASLGVSNRAEATTLAFKGFAR
jgi:cytochrome P450